MMVVFLFISFFINYILFVKANCRPRIDIEESNNNIIPSMHNKQNNKNEENQSIISLLSLLHSQLSST
jgi:hypothetical protein